MWDLLKGMVFGAIPDSAKNAINLKDIAAAVRKMIASAFWQAATLFVVTLAAGIQSYAEQHFGAFAAFIGLAAGIEGLVKLWGRFVKDYSGIAQSEPQGFVSRRQR